MSKILNAAVVGCEIGKSHMTAIQKIPQHFSLAAICEVDPAIDVIDLVTPPHLQSRFSALPFC